MIKNVVIAGIIFCLAGCASQSVIRQSEVSGQDQEKAVNEKFSHMLIGAAAEGSADEILTLISRGGDPSYASETGMTPLHVATHNGNIGVIHVLLESGANTEVATVDGITPLSSAVNSGNEESVSLLLSSGANVNFAPKPQFGPLYTAVLDGSASLLGLLISAGADVDMHYFEGSDHIFPLQMAKDVPIFTILMKHGANPNLFVDTEKELPFLFQLIYAKHYEKLRIALQYGADPDVSSEITRTTPLHFAAYSGDSEAVKILLEHKARTGLQDMDLNTPMDIALDNDHSDIVALLKKAAM
jgi:ankyrin repeat protein